MKQFNVMVGSVNEPTFIKRVASKVPARGSRDASLFAIGHTKIGEIIVVENVKSRKVHFFLQTALGEWRLKNKFKPWHFA